MERLGANVIKVPFADWWKIIETHQCPQAKGHFIHPGGEQAVLAGNSTIGLEIVEAVPDLDVVIVPYGSGSMATAVASVVKELRPRAKVFAVEPETAAPFAASMKAGHPVVAAYEPTFVDGCGGKSVLVPIWELAKDILDGGLTVSIAATAAAVKLVAERNRVVCEGAGACPVAAAMDMASGAGAGAPRKIVCVVSGGGLDSAMLCQILSGSFPATTGTPTPPANPKLAKL
jgi:threonine dehydratase